MPLRRLLRFIPYLALGLLCTVSTVVLSAIWLPFTRPSNVPVLPPGASLPGPQSTREFVTHTINSIREPSVQIGEWGDHLKPWHLVLRQPWATRDVWFEKGRVYNKPIGPKSASSAAVACWSFAAACYDAAQKTLTPNLATPDEITAQIQSRAWASCTESRGWPFAAASCRIDAPVDPQSPLYTVIDGTLIDSADEAFAIQAIRAIPHRPIWLGLILDTFIFAAFWWCAVQLLLLAFGRFRMKRGHCPACGYNLAGQTTPGCPECGQGRAPITPPSSPPPPVSPRES